MNAKPEGKGIFVWQLARCGDPVEMARRLKAMGISWVAVKAADGFVAFNDAYLPAFLAAMKSYGIEVWGWHYVYGARIDTGVPMPDKEAAAATTQMAKYNFAGWIVDPESEYKRKGSAAWAETYMSTIRTAWGADKPIALCSYRYPVLHPELPWAAFLKHTDIHMPQVYWMLANDPAAQLNKSMGQLKALKDIPFVPVGAAFYQMVGGKPWRPTVAEIDAFDAEVKAKGLSGLSWWVWDGAGITAYPEYEAAITSHKWANDPLDELRAEVAALAERIVSLEGSVTYLDGQNKALSASVETLKAADAALLSRVMSAETALDLVATKAYDNTQRLAALEAWARALALK